jgi:hypothetical protein
MPAAMFIAQATDTLQMLRDVGSGLPPSTARMTCEPAACRNFPSRLIRKSD